MKHFKWIAPIALLLLFPAGASASTPLQGEVTWTPKSLGKVRLAGSLGIAPSSSYSGNQGSVNFTGRLGKGKLQVRALQLRGNKLSGILHKKRVPLALVSGSRGELFSFSLRSSAKLTSAGARSLRRLGAKQARGGRSIGTMQIDGVSVHQIKSGTATITFNATLVNQFRYLTSEASGNFASFSALAAALPLSSNGVFQTVYASQLAANPQFLDGRISTPLVLNPNCVQAPAGSGPDALPNAAEASCAPASGTPGGEIVFPATGGELVGGREARNFMHAGGLGLQLRLGSSTLPLGGPNYGVLTAAAGNGIGGSVLREPSIDTTNGLDTLGMITSLGRVPIANLSGWSSSVVCDSTPDMDGNYSCTASADTSLTGLAAVALSTNFGTEIPPGTNLGSLETSFKIGS